MMVTASKVAKLRKIEGYRVVINEGKHGMQAQPNLYLQVIGGQ